MVREWVLTAIHTLMASVDLQFKYKPSSIFGLFRQAWRWRRRQGRCWCQDSSGPEASFGCWRYDVLRSWPHASHTLHRDSRASFLPRPDPSSPPPQRVRRANILRHDEISSTVDRLAPDLVRPRTSRQASLDIRAHSISVWSANAPTYSSPQLK